jgi:hypothetical protein
MTVSNLDLRDQLREAVSALCDDELQARLWMRGERLNDDEQTFDDALLFVMDQLETEDPAVFVGGMLVDDVELQAFVGLSRALDELLAVIGPNGTFADAVASGAPWQAVPPSARTLKTLLDASPANPVR